MYKVLKAETLAAKIHLMADSLYAIRQLYN